MQAERLQQPQQAIDVLNRLIEFSGSRAEDLVSRAVLRARLGQQEAALADAQHALQRGRTPKLLYQVGCVYALLGAADETSRNRAVACLEAALAADPRWLSVVGTDPDLATLRDDSHFQTMLADTRRRIERRSPDRCPNYCRRRHDDFSPLVLESDDSASLHGDTHAAVATQPTARSTARCCPAHRIAGTASGTSRRRRTAVPVDATDVELDSGWHGRRRPVEFAVCTTGCSVLAPDWQQTVLRAMQTWLVHTAVDLGIVADEGLPLGTPGPTTGDSRFGDMRLAARPLANDVMAISMSQDSLLSGTWAGDIILNSDAPLTSLDELFSVVLHETGHVLGLPHSDDTASPMHVHGVSAAMSLTPADIQLVQQRHGQRPVEAVANDQPSQATRLRWLAATEEDAKGQRPAVAIGEISPGSDVDVYGVRAVDPAGGPLTVRLQTQTISQLAAPVHPECQRQRTAAGCGRGRVGPRSDTHDSANRRRRCLLRPRAGGISRWTDKCRQLCDCCHA